MKKSEKFCWKNRTTKLYFIGVLFFVLSFTFGILSGSTKLALNDIFDAISNGFNQSAATRIFGYVRLPRTLASITCGMALSVAGVIIQSVLANRLASPGIIGVNAGAGLSITICTALGIMGGWQMSLFAFLGAFIAVMAVSIGAKKWGASRGTVILLGVSLSSLFGAISDTIITLVPDVGILSNNFKIGEFSGVTYETLIPAAIFAGLAVILMFTLSNELEILTMGDDSAKSLGMNSGLMRTVFLMIAALLSGCSVSLAGLLSFVGLIVPHIIRRIAPRKMVHLLGLSAIFGGGFVCLCDMISRIAFIPYEIPVGIIMSFIGVPFFIFILVKGKGGHRSDRA